MADVNVKRVGRGTPERMAGWLYGKLGHPAAGWQWVYLEGPGVLRVRSLPLPASSIDQRGGAPAHERATKASEAGMAKRSARAVNDGQGWLE